MAEGIRWFEDQSGAQIEGARARERAAQTVCCRPDTRQTDLERSRGGKLVSPERHRRCVQHVRERYPVSERRACHVLGQSRTSQRYQPVVREDESPLTAAIVRLAGQYGRYGY